MNQSTNAGIDLDKLLYIGDQMANVMFNLAQHAGDPLTGDTVAIMDNLRKEWDLARRAEPSVTEAPSDGLIYEAVSRRSDPEGHAAAMAQIDEVLARAALASPAVTEQADEQNASFAHCLNRTAFISDLTYRMYLAEIEGHTKQAAPAVSQKDGAAVEVQNDVWGVLHKPSGKWVKDHNGVVLLSKQKAENICVNDEYEARLLRVEIHAVDPAATTASASIDTAEFRKLSYAYAEALFKGTVPQTSVAWGALVEHIDSRATAPSRDAALRAISILRVAIIEAAIKPQWAESIAKRALDATEDFAGAALARAPLPAKGDERRTLAPLTNERIIEIADRTRTAESRDGDYILPISFARAIEAALEESAPAQAGDALEYRTCCECPDCTACAGRGGFYRLAAMSASQDTTEAK